MTIYNGTTVYEPAGFDNIYVGSDLIWPAPYTGTRITSPAGYEYLYITSKQETGSGQTRVLSMKADGSADAFALTFPTRTGGGTPWAGVVPDYQGSIYVTDAKGTYVSVYTNHSSAVTVADYVSTEKGVDLDMYGKDGSNKQWVSLLCDNDTIYWYQGNPSAGAKSVSYSTLYPKSVAVSRYFSTVSTAFYFCLVLCQNQVYAWDFNANTTNYNAINLPAGMGTIVTGGIAEVPSTGVDANEAFYVAAYTSTGMNVLFYGRPFISLEPYVMIAARKDDPEEITYNTEFRDVTVDGSGNVFILTDNDVFTINMGAGTIYKQPKIDRSGKFKRISIGKVW